jgi:hypothetical protein
MKPKLRFWIELLAVVVGMACVLAVFFGTVGAASSGDPDQPLSRQSEETPGSGSQTPAPNAHMNLQNYEGVIADTHCGAKHTPAIPETAADCTRMCVHSGEHFALVNGDKMYVLEGENQLLNRAAGERVTITGTLNGNTISVTSVRLPAP